MGEVTKQVIKENPDFFPMKPMDYRRFLVISLGTGSSKGEDRYTAELAKRWGVFGWLLSQGSTPLVDVFMQASADMVDIHISVAFQALHSKQNYLRIQVSVLFNYNIFLILLVILTLDIIYHADYLKWG
jgi:hypothetical protein